MGRPCAFGLGVGFLEGGLDFETPGFEEGFGDVFGVFVAAGPLAEAGWSGRTGRG